MTETQTAENYTPLEEIFNSLTHGIGILISLAGMVSVSYTHLTLPTIYSV